MHKQFFNIGTHKNSIRRRRIKSKIFENWDQQKLNKKKTYQKVLSTCCEKEKAVHLLISPFSVDATDLYIFFHLYSNSIKYLWMGASRVEDFHYITIFIWASGLGLTMKGFILKLSVFLLLGSVLHCQAMLHRYTFIVSIKFPHHH